MLVRLSLVASLLAITTCTTDDSSADPPMSTIQERIEVAEFLQTLDGDPELQAVFEMAMDDHGLTTVTVAGKVGDPTGVSFLWAEVTGGGVTGQLVRHCDGADCVRALQLPVAGPEQAEWISTTGPIPLRTLKMPFLLRLYDPERSDEAVIAPLSALNEPPAAASAAVAEGAPADNSGKADGFAAPKADGTPTDPNRKLRFISAFWKIFQFMRAGEFDTLVATMKSAGYPDTQPVYGVTTEQVDELLRTLGPKDALVWLSHGNRSNATGTVVSMSVADGLRETNKVYTGERMQQMLGQNPTGGPGLIFLSGCQTADLIPLLDNGQRIVLAFNQPVQTQHAYAVPLTFFASLSEGKTVAEALLDAREATRTDPRTQLVINDSADTSQTMVEVLSEPTPGSCTNGFAGSWQGDFESPEARAEGIFLSASCGDLVVTIGDQPGGGCAGCWLTAEYGNRNLQGCAAGSVAELTNHDDGAYMVIEFNSVTDDKLSVDVTGDGVEHHWGLLDRCP